DPTARLRSGDGAGSGAARGQHQRSVGHLASVLAPRPGWTQAGFLLQPSLLRHVVALRRGADAVQARASVDVSDDARVPVRAAFESRAAPERATSADLFGNVARACVANGAGSARLQAHRLLRAGG